MRDADGEDGYLFACTLGPTLLCLEGPQQLQDQLYAWEAPNPTESTTSARIFGLSQLQPLAFKSERARRRPPNLAANAHWNVTTDVAVDPAQHVFLSSITTRSILASATARPPLEGIFRGAADEPRIKRAQTIFHKRDAIP